MKHTIVLLLCIFACIKCQLPYTIQLNPLYTKTNNSNCIPTPILSHDHPRILEFKNGTDVYEIVNRVYFYAGFKGVIYDQTSYNDIIVTSIIGIINERRLTLDEFFEGANAATISTQTIIGKETRQIDKISKLKALYTFRSILAFLKDFYSICY